MQFLLFYAYAIENFQCYARGLHETCVMVTLNDRRIFDFERFLESYSRTIWPLFLWHMLFYVRHRKMSMHFDMAEFDKVIMLPSVRIQDPKWAIVYLGKKVRAKLFQLERRFKKFKDEAGDRKAEEECREFGACYQDFCNLQAEGWHHRLQGCLSDVCATRVA